MSTAKTETVITREWVTAAVFFAFMVAVLAVVVCVCAIGQDAGIRAVLSDGTMLDQIGYGTMRAGVVVETVSRLPDGTVRVEIANPGMPEYTSTAFVPGDRVWVRELYAGGPHGWKVVWGKEREVRPFLFAWLGMDVYPVLDMGHLRQTNSRLENSWRIGSVSPSGPVSVGIAGHTIAVGDPVDITGNTWAATSVATGVVVLSGKAEWPRPFVGDVAAIRPRAHLLEGGSSWAWDFRDPAAAPVPPPVAPKAFIDLMLWDAAYDPAAFPMMTTLRKMWRLTPASLDWRATVKDFGWRMRWYPERFAGKAPASPGAIPLARIPPATGPLGWGSMRWGDGHSNWHYDGLRWALEANELGVAGAWDIAYLGATHHARHGIIRTEKPSPVADSVRYEKSTQDGEGSAPSIPVGGNLGLVGDFFPPRLSHAWDMGFLAVAQMSGDPFLMETARRRGEAVLHAVPDVQHYGPRSWGWNAENLLAFWKLTGDERFHFRLDAELDRLFAQRPHGPCFAWPDDPVTGEWSPWQNMVAMALVDDAVDAGAALDPKWRPVLRDIRSKTIDAGSQLLTINGVDYLQLCMIRDRPPYQGAPSPDIWGPPGLTPMGVRLLWRAAADDPATFGSRWRAAMRVMDIVFVGDWASVGRPLLPGEVNADCSGWGSAGDKIAGDFEFGGRPKFMMPPSPGL